MLGTLRPLAGRLLKFAGGEQARGVLPAAAMSGGLNALITTAATGDPVRGLTYGVADFLGSYPATLAVRGLRPKGMRRVEVMDKGQGTGKFTNEPVISRLELPANVAASILATELVAANDPTLHQDATVAQQNAQRAAINSDLALANVYAPGTMYQQLAGQGVLY
ncbi:MAG: hypothetical protein Tp158DCM1229571_1 [Prokaryotic dsDNA virus sp.]|nr:MAG: hypothetical protein Tp158DCM1229571_1 [Prokaryotic dsDNA virus sp.]